MRITVVNRYFWPESILVNEISKWLVEDGHEVTVLTGQPDYNPGAFGDKWPREQMWHGVRIKRITLFTDKSRGFLRNMNSALYIMQAFLIVAFGKRCDVVWSSSIPPIVQPLLLRIATLLRGSRFVYFPQDIYPEIALSAGLVKEGLLTKIMASLDAWTLARTDQVVTISNDMIDVLKARGARPERIRLIRSFSPVESEIELNDVNLNSEQFRFVYAGNLGRFQNIGKIVDAFKFHGANHSGRDVQLEFVGDGREKAGLMKRVEQEELRNIRFHDSMPVEDILDFVKHYQVGIVTLMPGIYQYAFPAKFYTYLGAGVPLLVFVERESELAHLVTKRELGVVVSWSDDESAVSDAVNLLMEKYDSYRRNVVNNAVDLFSRDTAKKRWVELIDILEKETVGSKA